jgi:hypothetical protein
MFTHHHFHYCHHFSHFHAEAANKTLLWNNSQKIMGARQCLNLSGKK